MKASWTNQLQSLKGRRSILTHGDIGTEHFVSRSHVKQAQRKLLQRSPERETLQLCCGVSSGLDPCKEFPLQCPYFGRLFFPFPAFRISLGVLMIIIQFLPKVCVFNGRVRMEITVFMFSGPDSSCYIIQQWTFS